MPKTFGTIGVMQGGKTYYTVGHFLRSLADPDCLPFNLTHARTFNLVDVMNKINDHPVRDEFNEPLNVVTLRDKPRFKRFLDLLTSRSSIDDNTGFVGLNNAATHQKIASALINWQGHTRMYVDEYDTNQIHFNRSRIPVKKDNSIRSYLLQDLVDELHIISATNFAAAISDYTFEPGTIHRIKPLEGYWGAKDYARRIVDEQAIESLRRGQVKGGICDIIDDAAENVQINIDSSQEIHEAIYFALKERYKDEAISISIVNAESNFDLRSLNSGKHVIIGGLMFDRGVTFPRLSDLIIDKTAARQATLLQAAGRAFGYRATQPQIHATVSQHETLDASFRIEAQLTDEVLYLPVADRHDWLRENVRYSDELRDRALPSKDNGWKHQFETNVAINRRVATFETVAAVQSSGMDVKMLQTRVDGELIPKPYKGNITYGRKEVSKTVADLINKHPQTTPLHDVNEDTQAQRRRFIIPPINGTFFDRDFDDILDHWYIDNRLIDRDCSNPYVGSYLADGRIAVWHNLAFVDPSLGEGRITNISITD
jgi:hypothetical protein